MSWFSKGIKKVGKWAGDRIGDGPSMSGLKSSVKGTGKLVSKASDYVGMIPGVGQVVAPIMKTAGEVAAGTNFRDAALKGAMTFAGGKIGSAIGSKGTGALGKIPAVGQVANKLGMSGANGAAKSLTPGVMQALGDAGGALAGGGNMGLGSTIGNFAKQGIGDLVKGGVKQAVLGSDGKFGLDDIGRGIKKVGSFALDNPDLLLAGGAAYEGINASNDANKFRDRALAMAEQDAASRGQFRDMAMTRLGSAQRPDLGGLFAGSGNPYATQGSVPRVGGGAPAPVNLPPQVMGQPVSEAQAQVALDAFKNGRGGLIPRIGQMKQRMAEAA